VRLIDADKLNIDFYDEYETEDDEYTYRYVSEHQIDSAPTIKTKQIKYFDEDEKVWKVGSVIVDEQVD
jgi:hypothetical protein